MKRNEGTTVVLAGLLIDGTGRQPTKQAVIVIEDGRIVRTGPRSEVSFERDGSRILDFSEQTVIPGLIDAHCHIFYFNHHFRQPSVVVAVARAVNNARLWLEKGVTTARDICTGNNLDIGLRDAINSGIMQGPRLFVSGSGLAMTGAKQEPIREVVIEITGADEFRRVTRQQLRAGADFIKLFATAGMTEGGGTQLTVEEMRASVEEARKAGKTVAAHAIGNAGIKAAVSAGVNTIEHGTFLDEEAVAMMVKHRVALVPTLSITTTIAERGLDWEQPKALVENARRALRAHKESVRLAHGSGIKIVAGTDPVYDDTVAMECAALVEAGLSPMEAIVAATRSGAEILGKADEFGTIEHGKRADLLVLDGDPLQNMAVLERPKIVMKDGLIVKKTETSPIE